MAQKKSRRPKRLQEQKWDPLTTAYADLGSPDWDGKPFWTDYHNHQRYFQWLAIEHGIEVQDVGIRLATRSWRRSVTVFGSAKTMATINSAKGCCFGKCV